MRRTVSSLEELYQNIQSLIQAIGLGLPEPPITAFRPELEFIGLSGDSYVYKQRLSVNVGPVHTSAYLRLPRAPYIQISGGAASVEIDELNGAILITPSSSSAVIASVHQSVTFKAKGADLIGPPQTIGIDLSNIPLSQREMSVAGGGACAARWASATTLTFDVNVRASILADVRPTSESTRQIEWRHGRYFAHHPQLGFMSLYYDQDKNSQLIMRTLGTGAGFFPAEAENSINFICDFVDLGIKARSRTPMVQAISSTDWPPYKGPPLSVQTPLEFYDVQTDKLVMTIEKQDMHLYDYNSITVEKISFEVAEPGILRSRWRITNESSDLVYARWFMLGDLVEDPSYPTEGNKLLGARGGGFETFIIELDARVERANYEQKVSMNVVNVRDHRYSGAAIERFRAQ